MRQSTVIVAIAFLCTAIAAPTAWPQSAVCPGGRLLSGFQLEALPPVTAGDPPGPAGSGGDGVSLIAVNNLTQGSRLRYAPDRLPEAWRHSARVAVVLVPAAVNASTELPVFTQAADKAVTWTMPTDVGAVAFLFGPNGLNASKTRSMLAAHPELISQFIRYATRASRVEALVALLYRYEQSPPGSLDLKAMLKDYAAEYGVSVPTANAGLSAEQEASEMLASVAPPTAQSGPSAHAELTSGSTSTAAALASIYFGPEVIIANDTVPLFKALHKKLFPGTEFQGAFAQPASPRGMSLCLANVAPPAGKRPVYIWVADLPGGAKPSPRLADAKQVTIADRGQAHIQVTAASVAQLHALLRLRDWRLVSPPRSVAVPVKANVNETHDTLTLDLRQVKIEPGAYQLAARWDWSPVQVEGTVNVRAVPKLAGAKLGSGAADDLVAGAGATTIELTGADFSFVRKVELAPPSGALLPLTFTHAGTQEGSGAVSGAGEAPTDTLDVHLDLTHLAPGAYKLLLVQAEGTGGDDIAIAVHPPNPVLKPLPLKVNVGSPAEPVTLKGTHLERITQLATPGATWQLYPVVAGAAAAEGSGLTERGATVTLSSQAEAGQSLPVSMSVEGLTKPIMVVNAVEVLGPRPKIVNVNESPAAGGVVELLPGELQQDAITNVAFGLSPASANPAIELRCQPGYLGDAAVTLHPGESSSEQELDASGGGLYYLATTPGKIGSPGCQLQMIATDANGASEPYDLGRVVRLPKIDAFTLSNRSAGKDRFAGELTGDNLQLIAKTGWSSDSGVPVTSIPQRSAGAAPRQSLSIAMPWPPPAPHAPLYIWLRGEKQGRKTTVTP